MIKDGWHNIKGYDIYVENGLVKRGTLGDDLNYRTAWIYTKSKNGGWDNASGELTVSAFRARVKRGTVKVS